MKVAYKHLISLIPSKPSIDEISEKFFSLDMSMKLKMKFLIWSLPQTGEIVYLSMGWLEI